MRALFKWRRLIASEFGPRKSTTRHVLLTLSIHMDENGENCFPSTKTLAKEAGLSERAICEHLGIAESEGWLEKMVAGRTGQGWKLHKYKSVIPNKALTEGKHLYDKALTENQCVNDKGTDFHSEGTDFHDKKALILRQSSSLYNTTTSSSKRACKWPSDFCLTDQMKSYAISKGIDPNKLDDFFNDFRDWAISKDATYKNWVAAFRTRVNKAPEYGRQFLKNDFEESGKWDRLRERYAK